jgi:hypothetical protein
MSTKTIKQRIAVVAVSALTAGLFSVVSAPASNAAAGVATAGAINTLASSTTANPRMTHYDRLFIATMPTTTGAGVALTSSGVLADTANGAATGSARSFGLINVSDLAANTTPTAGTTQTAVILSTGALSVYTATLASFSRITVTGGTISSSTGTWINSSATEAVGGDATSATAYNYGVVVRPSSGSTSMIVRLFTGSSSEANAKLGTGATLTGQITVTVAAASTAGTISTLTSGVFGADTATRQGLSADHASFSAATAYNLPLFLNVSVKDSYGSDVTTTSNGILSVTATNGALVALENDNAATDGTQATAFEATTTPDDYMVRVIAPSTAPVATVVTVTFNGTVIGSKTLVFTGEVAKVTLSSPVIGKTGGTANTASYRLYDAAGNAVFNTLTVSGTASNVTAYPYAALINDASVNGGGKASAATRSRALDTTSTGVVTSGQVQFSCATTAGAGTIGVTYTNPSGTIVKSNALPVSCADSAITYAASWDKASYIPGDLAKLTITFKDSKGNLANDVDAIGATNVQDTPSVAIGGLDRTITGPVSSDTLSDGGIITYTYTIGTTEGTYSGKVTFPVVDRRQVAAGAASAAAVPVTLVVKAAGTAVTNADVLKSIVSLIASINKQIQALQKLILRR